jgi:sporulation protein YlmC with PRC-barrel domain
MNRRTVCAFGCIVCIAALLFVVQAFGEDPPSKTDTHGIQNAQPAATTDAAALVGKKVESKDGKELGRVQKILNNAKSGQPEYAIILSANKLYPAPLGALTMQPGKETVTLNVDKKRFNTAPSYHEDKMPDMSSPAINVLVNRFYSQPPS